MEDRACIGERAWIYNLDQVVLRSACVVAQEACLCTGSHDFETPSLPLKTAPIEVGADAFVGLRALVLQGVSIGAGAIIGAGAVVTRSVETGTVIVGSPARVVGKRVLFNASLNK
jgi:putative colanic acid biosynthesis acetyltransferase WcaF